MIIEKPKLKKVFKRVEVTTNHYNIKFKDDMRATRYEMNYSSKSTTSQDKLNFEHVLKDFKDPLKEIFEWHSPSGKVLYCLNKPRDDISSPEGKGFKVSTMPDGTIDIVKLLDDELESSSTVEEEELSESTLKLIPAGKELDLSQLAKVDADGRSEMLQVFNVCLASLMKHLKLKEFGISGRFFDHRKPNKVSLGKMGSVDVLSGFKVSAGVYQSGVPKILVDWQSRIIRSRSLWDEYCDAYDRNLSHDRIMDAVLGRCFVNTVNNKLVRIDGFDDKLTASSSHTEFETWGEFFKGTYGLKKIYDWEQPLVFSLRRKKVQGPTDSKPKVIEQKTYFLPEMLKGTGLTDSMKNDFRSMQEVARFTKIDPDLRNGRISKMVKSIGASTEAVANLFEIDNGSNTFNAMRMPKPKITFKDDTIRADRGNFFVKGHLYKPVDIKNWVVIWERDEDFAYDFSDALYEAGKRLGMSIEYPKMIALPEEKRKPDHLKKAVRKAAKEEPCIIVTISDPQTCKRGYKIYKDLCCKRYGIPHQNIRLNNKIFNGKKSRGIFDKIAIQMATKIGGVPWKVQQPLALPKGHKIMQIGADVFHSRGKDSIASVVGTLNATFTKHVSFSRVQPKRGQEITNSMSEMVLKSVDTFRKHNKFLPDTIIFYRDGVGRGQHDLVKEHEIKAIEEGLEDRFKSKAPKLVFILVTKRINDRFFTKVEDTESGGFSRGRAPRGPPKILDNPDSGLIVESNVTRSSGFDYFMVAQKVTQGTATPTHYEVIRNNSKLNAEFFYTLTYFMTFNYFNWSGPVKVPSVCQYAHKQAYLLGENHLLKFGKEEDKGIHPSLKKCLFYL